MRIEAIENQLVYYRNYRSFNLVSTLVYNNPKLQVKNDAAERGVKLGHAFLDRAKIEANYQNILQVVEYERKSKPNQQCSQKSKQEPSDNSFLLWS